MTFDKEMNYIDDKQLESTKEEEASSSDLGINDAQIVWREDSNVKKQN